MYEFTHGGMWFRWSALDVPSKWLLGTSIGTALLAAVPAAETIAYPAFRLGYALGSGGKSPSGAEPALSVLGAWWIIGFGIVSGLLWWKFSLRQDEMFNRVQNWALAMAGAWSATLLTIWALLDVADAAPPITPVAIIALFYGLILVFWIAAARRWA